MEPQPSVWKSTLEEFDSQIGQGDAITGAVAVASISAAFAVSLLCMVLEITARKKESESHQGHLQKTWRRPRRNGSTCRRAADEDRAAYGALSESIGPASCVRARPRGATRGDAGRPSEKATETPLRAARSAVRAMELCAEAAPLARGDVERISEARPRS